MRYLVTGGAGFIGGHLVEYLLGENQNFVCCFDKLTYAGNELRLKNVSDHSLYSFVKGDICDERSLQEVMNTFQPEIVINLAAETHVDNSIRSPEPFVKTNILGVEILLKVCTDYWGRLSSDQQKVFRFYQISTDEVYGDSRANSLPADENSPYRPSSPYSASKAAADHLVRSWHRTYGLPILISASSNNFGTWQYPEKLIPCVIKNILTGLPVRVFGDGRQMRDWLFVRDHVRAIVLIAEAAKPGSSYNISTEMLVENRTLVEKICEVVERETAITANVMHVEDRPGHDFCYRTSSQALRKEFGWRPESDFDQTLNDVVVAYLRFPKMLGL